MPNTASPPQSPLLRSNHRETERLGSGGHASVVGNKRVELVSDLECGREMKRVKRPQRHRFEHRRSRPDSLGGFDHRNLGDHSLRVHGQLGYGTSNSTHDLDFDDGTRELISVTLEQIPQGTALRFLDNKLDERRRVDVDQIRSSRDWSSTSPSGRSSLIFAGGGRSARLPAPRRSGILRASSRTNLSSAATIGCRTATGWPRSVTSKASPRRTLRR